MELLIIISLLLIIVLTFFLKVRQLNSILLGELVNKMNYLNFKIDKLEASIKTEVFPKDETVRISESFLRMMDNQYETR